MSKHLEKVVRKSLVHQVEALVLCLDSLPPTVWTGFIPLLKEYLITGRPARRRELTRDMLKVLELADER